MEENPALTILEIIDPTITVSADSSFVMYVTELKTKILTAFENEIRVSFLQIVNPFTPKSDLINLLCLMPDDFARQRETPWE